MTEPAQSAAETTNALTATEDIRYDIETPENVFEFDGVRAIVDWWQFDGKTLKLQYDIDFGTKRCEDIVNDISPRITPMGDFEASTTLDVFEQKENSIKMRATIELFHYADSISLSFLDNNEYVRMKHGEIEAMSPDAYRELDIFLIDLKKTSVQYCNTDFEDTKDPEYPYRYHIGKIVGTAAEVSYELLDVADPSEFENIHLTAVDFDGSKTLLGKGTFVPDGSGGGILSFPTNGIDIDIADVYYYSFERSTQISVDITRVELPGKYEFLYYIDGELQQELTETKDFSETDKIVWDISGTGTHTYKIMIRRPDTQASGDFLECTVDFSKTEPTKDFGAFNSKIFKELTEIQQEDLSLIEGIYPPGYEPPYEVIEDDEESVNSAEADLPEFPKAISNGNGFYGEYIDTPITGDEAWELVKERGSIDFDYNLPYDKSLFTFTGAAFVIDYADFDVTALAGGIVEFAGFYQGWGNTVLILDDNSHYWLYGHLAKDLNVAQGNTVEAGVKLGHTGSTGVTDHQRYAMRVG
ncbi:MAG TPA: hypothetical protein DDX72_03750 [Ruminococcaceae bacterium]|nr:hypothetical protein [Oscillospiraceae bacterium]